MNVSEFEFQLPPALIAQRPAVARDRSRLLVLDRRDGLLEDRIFADLPAYLREGDVLVLNDAKVIPARLHGRSKEAAVEILLVREHARDRWEALLKPSKKGRPGREVIFVPGMLEAVIEERLPGGRVLLRLTYDGDFRELLGRFGAMPLPPYIKRQGLGSGGWGLGELDRERYQTVYARAEGAIAAPTAGLHFTWELLHTLQARGVQVTFLTLDVGIGTFQPVRTERVKEHRMEPERYRIPEETAQVIKTAKAEGRRVVSVGTTTVRALEDAAEDGEVKAGEAFADLFIFPGYRFKVVDALITNFHLPRSTLLMLVSAFAGRELIGKAYQHAIERRYRFYSYGDAMLIL